MFAAFWGCFIAGRFPFLEKSTRAGLDQLGFEFADLDGFTCCPEKSLVKNRSEEIWLLTAARNLALAEEAGHDLFSPCNGCVGTLKGAEKHIVNDSKLHAEVNEKLATIGKRLEGNVDVRHLLEILHDVIGLDRIRQSVVHPLKGLRVAVHAGCHQTRPSEDLELDDPLDPTMFEKIIKALGATVVDYPSKLLCCGGTMNTAGLTEPAENMTRRKLRELSDIGVDCICVVCPACFMQYDIAQFNMERQGHRYNVPVAYIMELICVAMGLDVSEMGLDMHRIPIESALERFISGASDKRTIRSRFDIPAMERCLECQACSRNCAAMLNENAYSPYELMRSVVEGDLGEALKSEDVWRCLECYECKERCFQNFGMITAMRTLKELAIERGLAPTAVTAGIQAFEDSGLLTQPSASRRKKLGLPDSTKSGIEELRELVGLEAKPRKRQESGADGSGEKAAGGRRRRVPPS
jgi:heterodisulfide reductase subunit B